VYCLGVPRRGLAAQISAEPNLLTPADIDADNIDAYIAGDRRRSLASHRPIPDRVSGSALFADISGYTPLTEAFVAEYGPRRGAEEITAAINRVFDAVLGELHRFGGSVIYFAGDAVTCWLDSDDGSLAVACGLAMQEAMSRVETITTPGGRTVQLGMKIAVANGEARRFVAGDPKIQLIDVLAGSLMDRLANTEHHSETGEVVVDALTLQRLNGRLDLAVMRGEGDDQVGVVLSLNGPSPSLPPPPPYPELPRSTVREWLLPPVYDRVAAGRGDFLAELRPSVPMFVHFGGIDYDNDPNAQQLLDDFIRKAQRVVAEYGGNVLQLIIGDKGAYLHAVFGTPIAHEDDAGRACAAALDLVALEGSTAATEIQVGISKGRLRSGTCGHHHRRAFTCVGDAVNLAARLMANAPFGQVYVAEEVAVQAGETFDFEELPPLKVKGKSAPVKARRLAERRLLSLSRQRRATHELVGRSAELEKLLERADTARLGNGQVVGIVAEAGMGKSRLVAEAVRMLEHHGMKVCSGAASSIGSASYLVWHDIWAGLLGLKPDGDPVAEAGRALAAVDPGLLPRLPLLAAVLGISIDDNDLTRSFDAKLRKASLESLLVQYLTMRAQQEPILLVLEDCHWLDPLSADLLEAVSRVAATLPVLILATYRPGAFTTRALDNSTELDLNQLDPSSSRELLRSRLADLYGPDNEPLESLLERLSALAGGNPFYLEELVNYLHSNAVDITDKTAVPSIDLPDSLATLVLSRIDMLTESPRRTLKVASVVGRQFLIDALVGAYPDLGGKRRVGGYLRRLCTEDLVLSEDSAASAFSFKHAVIREVAYDSLPFAQRAILHGRIGFWLERTDPQALDLLAHHFWFSGLDDKRREYLVRAGDAAQAKYANEAAVDYFRRVAPLLADQERIDVLTKLGAVLELTGAWSEAETVFTEAMELAESLGLEAEETRARTARADTIRKQGRFEAAIAELNIAARNFEALGDTPGLGRVAHLRGTIAAQTGDYAEARAQYEKSLSIRVALGDGPAEASLLSNLAIVAEYEEDYDRAQALNEQALELRTRLGDRWGIGISHNNLGMIAYLRHDFSAARADLEGALRFETEVGDTWMIAISRHNLGNAFRELGDETAARSNYSESLRTYSQAGDQWAQCLLFEDIAMLAAESDPLAALQLIGAADKMRESIGSPRVAAQQAELDSRLASVRDRLGEDATKHQTAGRELEPESVHHLAVRLCLAGP
jgi:adenylate cyclase